MSSPITSVPEPSEAASTSSDPLAGVITQVSPRQAAAPIRGGPARPTKVAKQGTAKAANLEKKKKKKSVAGTSTDEATDKGNTDKTIDAKEETTSNVEEGAAGPSADLSPVGDASTSHSQNPSSTIVGTTTTQPSTLTTSDSGEGSGREDKPSDAALTPIEPAPSTSDVKAAGGVSGQQDMAEAAQKLSKPVLNSKPSVSKVTTSNEKTEMLEKDSTSQTKSAPAPTSKSKGKQKQKGLVARIVAILTCSSATGAMVAAESDDEKRLVGDKSTTRSQATNGKVNRVEVKKSARPKNIPASHKGSMERNATAPGGGTILSKEETGDVMSGAVVPPGSSFVPHDNEKRGVAAGAIGAGVALGAVAMHKQDDSDDEDGDEDDEWMGEEMHEDDDQTEEQRLIQQGGVGIPKDENGNERPLLGPIGPEDTGRKCLVLDLDETLVHSSFKMISNADFIVPVEIEGTVHNVYVIKRPGVDEFMRQMGEIYEVVVFTASLAKYADPVLDILDIHQVVRHRLFRESCYNHKGNYVKDLSQLGREIHTSIIIDNSPASYIFHPNNAVPISSWFNDPHDTELTDLCPFLAELADVDDVRAVLDGLL